MKEQINVHLKFDASTVGTDVTISTYDQDLGVDLLKYIQQYEAPSNKLGVKTSQGVYLITKTEIIFAEIFDKQLTIVTTEATYTTRMTLYNLQQALPEYQFVQISKSSIVNIEHITKVAPSFSGNLYATLSNHQQVTISRRYVKKLTQSLGI
ncbi:LytTR family DNA-binding domain-containing protein [Staphylococcus americanisciuri]|uniref:LytTR family transcriptional regulator n=1 Tax=Staphylococcus americanisciuri TaxID=2973940 RepID=A0ABT2F097_9STAP|nr:LytTR family DNA-binding domain-containing protein [Staphylococcus americanisciuri]MCS4485869.1 LytTR family transcriptional regulator [Staphylococcus americanisciuri]